MCTITSTVHPSPKRHGALFHKQSIAHILSLPYSKQSVRNSFHQTNLIHLFYHLSLYKNTTLSANKKIFYKKIFQKK